MAEEEVVDGDVPLAGEFEPGGKLLDQPIVNLVYYICCRTYQSHEFHQSA